MYSPTPYLIELPTMMAVCSEHSMMYFSDEYGTSDSCTDRPKQC